MILTEGPVLPEEQCVESICYDMDIGGILLKNNFLQERIEDMRLQEMGYQNEIQRLKIAVSYLEETSAMKESEKSSLMGEINELKRKISIQMDP